MMLASRFREADLLYQLGALQPAAARLQALARTPMPESVRLAALCRLAEIACDDGDLRKAEAHLTEMRRCAERSETPSVADRAEIDYATARYAFSRRDGSELQRRAREAILLQRRAPGNDRVASLAIRINSYLAVDGYHRRDLAAASEAAARAAALLSATPGALGYVKTHALTTRAVIDLHDVTRAHLATDENIEALELALANGMISTAHDALFNIVNLWLYCDDWDASPHERRSVRESLDDALIAPSSTEDPVLAALSLCAHGRHAQGAQLLDERRPDSREKSSDWLPIFFGPVTATKRARMLFKAGKFVEAERAAAQALAAWEHSHLGGQGTALRVRAEALEAMGDLSGATAAVEDAIAELESMKPLHHMIAAHQCAYRLTKKRAYREQAQSIIAAFRKPAHAHARLSRREREVALLVAQGQSNKAIAVQLNLKPRTVENYVASIFAQLSIRARWQLTPDLIDGRRAGE